MRQRSLRGYWRCVIRRARCSFTRDSHAWRCSPAARRSARSAAPPDLATHGTTDGALPPIEGVAGDMATTTTPPPPIVDLSPPTPRRIFVTAETYAGNLIQAAGNSVALEAADALCGTAAAEAQLSGTWRAWLSADNTNAIDRMSDGTSWQLIGTQIVVFADRSSLATTPTIAINRNQYGGPLASGSAFAWTQTSTGGS